MRIVDVLLSAYGSLQIVLPDGNAINLVKAKEGRKLKRAKPEEPASVNKPKRRAMSLAVRRKIAKAQRARWKAKRLED